ncbi:hypothetical protein B0H19DRAFT_1270971 [Mycena capillaripes]|nr:hypothetical protein B0H19DRAFT_1270971 [Mycena capillaripes]
MLPSYASKALFDADTKAGGLSRRACTPETRKELLDRLEHWVLDTSSDSSPIFWLSGMAGTGKSTVAYTLCQRLRSRKRCAASFFCSRNDEKARSRAFIIPTIVRQLIPVYTRYAHAIRNVHLDDVVPASDRHVDELLIHPWLQSMEQQIDPPPSRLIVIDALDEIEDGQGARLIEHLIKALSSPGKTLQGLKFLVTSRPHPHIVEQCHPLQESSVYRLEYIEPEKAKADVRRFVRAELEFLPAEDQDYIVDQSTGIFIYAATVIRHLCPPNFLLSSDQQKKRLQQIRNSGRLIKAGKDDLPIDSLYKSIILEALPDIGQEVEIPKRVLYAVITARQPHTVQNLAPLVADASEEADERAVQNSVSALHAVLYVSKRDRCIYSYHKSFDDFVLDPQRYEHAHSAAA